MGMLQQLRHRGEPSYFAEVSMVGNAVIGCNRLGITDEPHGAQPKRSAGGRWTGVMNGEIYNHRDIRKELAAAATDSDIEALLLSVDAWGVPGISRLEGMFAFCLVDTASRYLLGRDRLGVKPMYYGFAEDTLYFASELKALAQVSGLQSIMELPGGCLLEDGQQVRYYQPPPPSRKPGAVTPNEMNQLRQSLESAVKACLPEDDGPVAVLLSGGVDSSTIAMLTERLHRGPVVAYTLGTGASTSEDVAAASEVCRTFDIEHIIVSPLSDDLTRLYLNAGVWMTESFETALVRNAVSYFHLCEAVRRDGFKFCLSGEGADEVFGGYDYMRLSQDKDAAIARSLSNIQRTYLQMADRASMFATLEVRVPYMERCVVEAAMDLPSSGRIGLIESKSALRQLYKGVMPDAIRLRPKLGMNAGGGYGGNNPGESVYHQAVLNHYSSHPGLLARDLKVANAFPVQPAIDLDDAEQVFNLTRFKDFGFDKLIGVAARQQLNTSRLID